MPITRALVYYAERVVLGSTTREPTADDHFDEYFGVNNVMYLRVADVCKALSARGDRACTLQAIATVVRDRTYSHDITTEEVSADVDSRVAPYNGRCQITGLPLVRAVWLTITGGAEPLRLMVEARLAAWIEAVARLYHFPRHFRASSVQPMEERVRVFAERFHRAMAHTDELLAACRAK